MLTIDQRVTVNCTDTGVDAEGTIIRIRPDGIDVALDTLTLRLMRQEAGLYVGNHSGLEFVVQTQTT